MLADAHDVRNSAIDACTYSETADMSAKTKKKLYIYIPLSLYRFTNMYIFIYIYTHIEREILNK